MFNRFKTERLKPQIGDANNVIECVRGLTDSLISGIDDMRGVLRMNTCIVIVVHSKALYNTVINRLSFCKRLRASNGVNLENRLLVTNYTIEGRFNQCISVVRHIDLAGIGDVSLYKRLLINNFVSMDDILIAPVHAVNLDYKGLVGVVQTCALLEICHPKVHAMRDPTEFHFHYSESDFADRIKWAREQYEDEIGSGGANPLNFFSNN